MKSNNRLARRDLDKFRELFLSERLFQKSSGDRVLHHQIDIRQFVGIIADFGLNSLLSGMRICSE